MGFYFNFFARHKLHFKYRIVAMSDNNKVVKTGHGWIETETQK